MRAELISHGPADGYNAGDVAIADWPPPAMELAELSLAPIREEGQRGQLVWFRPANSFSRQPITTNLSPPSRRRRSRLTASPPFLITPGVSAPPRGPLVHPGYFYHNVGYYAREKFSDAVGYAFSGRRRRAAQSITYCLSVDCRAQGLGQEHSFSGRDGGRRGAFSMARTSISMRDGLFGKKRRLAHSAVRRFTMFSGSFRPRRGPCGMMPL